MTFRNKNNNNYNNKNKTFRNSNHVNSLQIGGNKKGGSDTKTMDNINTVYKQFKKHEKFKEICNYYFCFNLATVLKNQ